MNVSRQIVVGSALLAMALLLGGCRAPAGDGSPTTSSTSTPGATTTGPEREPCPRVPPPRTPTQSSIELDLDGDGIGDELAVHPVDRASLLRAELSGGGSAQARLGDLQPVLPLGGVDLDEDADDEAWVVTGSGAATQLLSLFDLRECALRPLTPRGGLPVGATVRNSSGLFCEDVDEDGRLDVIVHIEMSSSDGERYSGTATRYRVTPGGLEQTSVDEITRSVSSPGPVGLGGFACGGLRLG